MSDSFIGSFVPPQDHPVLKGVDAIVKFESADHFFGRVLGTHWEDFKEQAEAVVQAMKTHLREPSAAIIGRDDPALGAEHPFYVVGIDAAVNLVGLKSGVVWT